MYINYNPNPLQNHVGDCTVRAISKVLNQDWEDTYLNLCLYGFSMCDMPSSNAVWGAYLKSKGFERFVIPNTCPNCYSVKEFCEENPEGTFLLALGSHVVAVENGNYYDIWDSGNEIPIYFWKRKED